MVYCICLLLSLKNRQCGQIKIRKFTFVVTNINLNCKGSDHLSLLI